MSDLNDIERRLNFLKNELKNTENNSAGRKIIEHEIMKADQMLCIGRYINILNKIVELLESGKSGLDYGAACVSANFTLECMRRYFKGVEYINHTSLSVHQLNNKINWARIMLNAFSSGL